MLKIDPRPQAPSDRPARPRGVFFYPLGGVPDGETPRGPRAGLKGTLKTRLTRELPRRRPPVRSDPRRSPSACAEKMLKIDPRPQAPSDVRRPGVRRGVREKNKVQSGAGRSGRWWAHEHWDVAADIMVFAKVYSYGPI